MQTSSTALSLRSGGNYNSTMHLVRIISQFQVRTAIEKIFRLILLLVLLSRSAATAQHLPHNPQRIIFSDSLNRNRSITLKWNILNDKAEIRRSTFNNIPALEFEKGSDAWIEPYIKPDTSTNEQITFECDYFPVDTGRFTFAVLFSAKDFRDNKFISLDKFWMQEGWKYKDRRRKEFPYGPYMTPLYQSFPGGKFNPSGWHHVTIVFTRKGLNIFLDSRVLLATAPQDWGFKVVNEAHRSYFMPDSFLFGGDAPYAIKNVRFFANSNS